MALLRMTGRVARRRVPLVAVMSLLTAAAGLWASLPSAAATSDPRDAQATLSYLRSADAFFRADIANLRRGALAVDKLAGNLAKECPGVASAAGQLPPGETTARLVTDMREEAEQAVVLALISPDQPAYRRLGMALPRLRWRDRRVTVLVRRFGLSAAAIGKVRPPDLCADMKEWAAGGYTKLPAGTTRFLDRFAAARHGAGGIQEQIEVMLRPYQGARGRLLEARVRRHRIRLSRLLVAALTPAAGKVRSELGFSPPPGP